MGHVVWIIISVLISIVASLVVHATASAATVTGLSTGTNHACSVVDNKAKCWGSGASGQLGNKSTSDSTTPVEPYAKAAWAETIRECHGVNILGSCVGSGWKERVVNHPNSPLYKQAVTKVSAGYNHTCVIASARVHCWGNNDNGQLGNGTTTDSTVPVAVTVSSASALSNKEVIDVSAGYYFTCALSSDGSVACWGRNDSGQLGNDNRQNKSTPVAVSRATDTRTGDVCLSRNIIGACMQRTQIGPSALVDKKVKKLAVAKGQTSTMCAITVEDKAICWGQNDLGQVGNGGEVAKSGRGNGSDRANQAHRCSLTKANAYRSAVSDLPENKRQDALRPAAVQSALSFSDITIVGKRENAAMFGMNSNNTSTADATSYEYVTAKTTGASRAHYWGGSFTDDATVDCKVNGQAYYGESTTSNATVERVYHSLTTPSAALYASNFAGPLRNQSIALLAGNAYVGSNWAEQGLCTTYTVPWFFTTKSKEVCNTLPEGLACATPTANRSTAYCDKSTQTCTDNSNGTAFHIAMLKLAGTYVQTCTVNGLQQVATGGDSWLKSGMTLTAMDIGSSGYTCAVASNNTIGCWGKNDKGQLGVGDKKDKTTPTAVRL